MRARNIKPSLFANEVLGEADPLLTILFEGLWCLADCNGVLEDRPKRIKSQIFPYREISDLNIFLNWLVLSEFIVRYHHDGTALIQVLKFVEHQHPHPSEKSSGYPVFIDADGKPGLKIKNNGDILFKTPSYLLPLTSSLNPSSLIAEEEGGVSNETPAAPVPEIKSKKKSSKPRDERQDHPAIKMVHEIMALWPHKDLWNRIIREIGDEPDVVFYTASFEQWRSVNGNKMNFEKWLFEPSRTGMIPEIFGNGPGNNTNNRNAPANVASERKKRIDAIIDDSSRFKRPEFVK